MEDNILIKWEKLIKACKNYYVDCIPTGLLDSEYDELEKKAIEEDNFYVRDYIFQNYLKGVKTKNSYIEKIEKTKVEGQTMLDALISKNPSYALLKYDGSSIAIYIDPTNGVPRRIVTCGNLNREAEGVDQTSKLLHFLPKRFPLGIVAVQCEALIDTNRIEGDPERARQQANGYINSKYCEEEINKFLTLRAYRYYTDDSPVGIAIREANYRDVLYSFETTYSQEDSHVLFAPADVFTIDELKNMKDYCETDKTVTTTGCFLNDGWVMYNEHGICQGALKYAGAGSNTENLIKTKVKSLIWNNQSKKGKDSWSCNVEIDPVTIKGCIVKKPSAGSVSKLVKNNITPGAEVSVILANSTIPMIGESFSAGNGNFMWPTCSCGYQMSDKDIYGSLLKCGNPMCSDRLARMRTYINSLDNIFDLDLNKFLVIDRFKWEQTNIDIKMLLSYVSSNQPLEYFNYLMSYMKTDLQKKNMELVSNASWTVLMEVWLKNVNNQ